MDLVDSMNTAMDQEKQHRSTPSLLVRDNISTSQDNQEPDQESISTSTTITTLGMEPSTPNSALPNSSDSNAVNYSATSLLGTNSTLASPTEHSATTNNATENATATSPKVISSTLNEFVDGKSTNGESTAAPMEAESSAEGIERAEGIEEAEAVQLPGNEALATTTELANEEAESTEPKPTKKKRGRPAASPSQLPEPLAALPASTKLPDLEDFNLRAEQTKNPLFVAICKVLLVYGNHWQSAMDLVDGVRHFGLASLGGRTPKGTIQGAISTGLALAQALKTFEPIEKLRLNSTTYYRMDLRVLEEPSSDARESFEAGNDTKIRTTSTIRKKKPAGRKKKRKPVAPSSDTSDSDSMEEDYNDDEDRSSNGYSKPSSKRVRTDSPPMQQKILAKQDMPNGLKKLPKGYVYDTDINQSALMNLSINPTQTGEFMEHLKGQQALLEIEYPDKRSQYGVDLTKEPMWFAVEQQTGYTYPRLRTSRRERLTKPDCEDGYAVADLKHSEGYLGRLFCITDGHGGRACSSFVIATIPGVMQVILGKYKPEDLSLPDVQETVKTRITEAIRLIDKEYLDHKKQQYLLYKAKKLQHDPGSDGTTLIVNIFIDKWLICVNVGDSRTILSTRDMTGRWNVDFSSEDHTPSLERLAQTIYANGGEFVTHDDKVIRFDPNFKNDKKHRQSLKEARIRVKNGASNLYGIPYRTRNGQAASINLGACIGDVLYKLDPVKPILSSKPDITFIDISSIQHGYLLMASDGLWDYVMRGGKMQDQNAAVSQFVGDKIDRGWTHQRIVSTLSDREGMTGLYTDSIQEYDDFTAILVTINSTQQNGTQGLEKKSEPEGESAQQEASETAFLSHQEQHQQEDTPAINGGESVVVQSSDVEPANNEAEQPQTLAMQADEDMGPISPKNLQSSISEHLPRRSSEAETNISVERMDIDEGEDSGPESTLTDVDLDDMSTDLDISPSQDQDQNMDEVIDPIASPARNSSEDIDI
ncbi:hypothetical protein BX616_003286 [Lobosporangium transversale]|uniref:PPM-type phosphatase domain-containing protein n=1 Tax=Lobosporangium transversale TaxID=64571 RepID=A0A1Y2GTA4_9FUNG|nr:hypothetical protein BCR41DRAFT_385017 [Lobosporangium transversale]KAF9899095.1 hypothetical protein BX616_003286 [Lobosporangium transversale]ORZ22708.1 hypothetical protein BCR41DRAFT_385017 [Lobosporangium transversale]|eukprot:XP_021883262.1 hypothetical protein BCR41DRAFT_385017 [Lobosporangium transversale]